MSMKLNLDLNDLAGAPLESVLLHGLTIGGDDALEAVLFAIRCDLDAAARLAAQIEVANALDGLRRRVEVALELRRREMRRRMRSPKASRPRTPRR